MDTTDAVAGSRQRVVGLADLGRLPVRRWRTVVIVAALIVLAVLGYLRLVPATYTATTEVVVRAVVTDPFTYASSGADRTVNMTAENGLALSNGVIDATAKATGMSADDVRKALTVELPTGGQVLRFDFKASSENKSINGANTAANTYLSVREQVYETQRTNLLKSEDAYIKTVTDARAQAEKSLPGGTISSSPGAQSTLDQIRALNDQLGTLSEDRANLASADLNPGSVTSAARSPVPSSHDGAVLFLLGGLLGGLLIGALVAIAREALDRRIRSAGEASEVTGLPVLGSIRSPRRGRTRVATVDVKYVALAVAAHTGADAPTRIVVLSPRGNEGRSLVAGGLAVSLAEAGQEVYLGAEKLDDLRAMVRSAVPPGQPAVPPQKMPTANEEELNNAETVVGFNSGALLALAERSRTATVEAGSVPVGAGSVELGPFTTTGRPGVVVLDAPGSELDDRGVRAARGGVAVLVAARDHTRSSELSRLSDRLRVAGVTVIGVVLTGDGRA